MCGLANMRETTPIIKGPVAGEQIVPHLLVHGWPVLQGRDEAYRDLPFLVSINSSKSFVAALTSNFSEWANV